MVELTSIRQQDFKILSSGTDSIYYQSLTCHWKLCINHIDECGSINSKDRRLASLKDICESNVVLKKVFTDHETSFFK